MGFLLFGVSATSAGAGPAGQPGGGRPAPLVALGEVVEREVRNQLSAVGTVAPFRTSIVSSEIEGRVKSAPLREGDFVSAGETVIATLSRTDLEIELRILLADLEKARQEHLRLQRGSRKEEIEAARSRLHEREARLRRDELELKRNEDLFKRQIIDRATYDRVISNYESSKSQVLEARYLFRLAELGPREEEVARAKADLERVRAQVDRVKDDLSKAVVRSPLTGFVTEKWVEVGQWVQKGGRVAEVVELGSVLVRTPISENQIALVRRGDAVRVAIDALGGRIFPGQVRSVIPKADPKSRTFPVEVELRNTPDHAVKAGMFARISMEYGDPARAVLVPKDAVQLRARRPAVFVFEGGKVREVGFTAGRSVDTFVEVTEGELKAGMRVVVQGNEALQDGMPVRLRGGGGRPAAGPARNGQEG